MKKQPLIWGCLTVFRWLISTLSQKNAVKIGTVLGSTVTYVTKRKVKEATKRCSDVLSIPMDEAEEIVKKSYRHFGGAAAEFARMPKIAEEIKKYVKIVGEENLQKAYVKNKGIIFATAHIGNWEYAACLVAQKGYKMSALGAEQRDDRLTDLIAELRTKSGIKALGKKSDLKTVIKALKNGEIIGIPVDQDAKKAGVLSLFLGKPASTPVGIAKLAQKTGCAIIPAFCIKNKDNLTYTLTLLPELKGRDGKEYGEDIQTSLDDCNDVISEWIRKTPEQWMWMYPRWESFDRGEFDETGN
ncbi:MAG: lysophospholipid acyltransferase family protein [Synergistaceae bacterium]